MRQINIQLSNRAIYTVVAMMLIVLVGAGILVVNAYGGSSPAVVGHSIGELDGLGDLATKDSVDWTEITSRPSGLDDGDDVRTKSGTAIYYVSYSKCSSVGFLTPSSTCKTIKCNLEHQYTSAYDCSGACRDGWYPQTCSNTFLGYLVTG